MMKRNIMSGFVPVVLISFMALPLLAAAQDWTWTTSQIDVEGTDSAVAVDHAGDVHVSYRSPTHDGLKYAFLPAGSSRWFTMTLDPMLGSFLTSITLNSDGNPYICYTPGSIKLASFDGTRWKIQEIDPGVGLVSYYCSVRVGSDKNPQLSWYVESRIILRYAALQNGVWIARSVDESDSSGKFNSLTIDRSGKPQLSYIGLNGTRLKYARLVGGDWTRSTLEGPDRAISKSRGDTGMGNSITLDLDGNPLISYFDVSSLKFAHQVDGKWQFEIIDQYPTLMGAWSWRIFRSIIALDREGHPHIGYQSPLGLKHAWWDGSQWNTRVIIAPTGSTFDGGMAIDEKNNIYFTYTDPVQHTLMLATGRYTVGEQAAKANSSSESRKQP